MDKKDQDYQERLKLQHFLESAGMQIFKAELNDDVDYASNEIDKSMNRVGFISAGGLNKLNYDLGRKAGLQMVLNRLASYEDNLVGENVKSQ